MHEEVACEQTLRTDIVLGAVKQALPKHRPRLSTGLRRYSDIGSRHITIPYGKRVGKAAMEPSIGYPGDRDGNALA